VTKAQVPVPLAEMTKGSGRWTGWVVFASIMLVVVGGINIIQGLAALLNDSYFVVRSGNDLLIANFDTWGVIMVVWGAAQSLAGLGLNSGRGWARVVAIVVAAVSMIVQTLFLAAYPIWSVMIIALDVIIIYALTARWAEAREGL
jgi:hypothetical protein